MTVAITIGAYALPDFVELCCRRCRVLFPDAPILIADDLSAQSADIQARAERHHCMYVVSQNRRSHFSGDIQAIITALALAEAQECDIALKISQRFIPVLPEFRSSMERAFSDPSISLVLPGRVDRRQILRPQSQFFSKFGIQTDVVAIRRGSIAPQTLVDTYRDRVNNPKSKSDSLVETTIGYLAGTHFRGATAVVAEWTNHRAHTAKVFLRRCQSSQEDYQKLGVIEGIKGKWDLREWGMIERKSYRMKSTSV
jgi:hypothetical protein